MAPISYGVKDMSRITRAGGLSRNPAESPLTAECAAGAQVLLDAVPDRAHRRTGRREEVAA